MPYVEILDIQTRKVTGELYVEFAVWRNQADYDAGQPAVHVNDWIMPVNRQIRVTDAQGRVRRVSDGAWITPEQADAEELGRFGIEWRRKTRAEVRQTVLRRLREYIRDRLPAKLQAGEPRVQRMSRRLKQLHFDRSDPNDLLVDADTLKGYKE